ncbi:sulfur relay protein TusC [compost metagenome]
MPLGSLFLDDGVFKLVAQQQPTALEQKDLTANLQALPLFGVESLYASARSLQERGLDNATLNLTVDVLDDSALTTLIDRYDQVLTL